MSGIFVSAALVGDALVKSTFVIEAGLAGRSIRRGATAERERS